jgi:hypothetical protein
MFSRLLIPFGYMLSQRRKIIQSTATRNSRVHNSLSSESCAAGPKHVPERNLVAALVICGDQLHRTNWMHACFAALGSWIGAFASMTFLHRPVREAPIGSAPNRGLQDLTEVAGAPERMKVGTAM